jgi:hypothetical protein
MRRAIAKGGVQTSLYRVLLSQLLHELKVRKLVIGLGGGLTRQGGDALRNVGGTCIAHADLLLNAKARDGSLLSKKGGGHEAVGLVRVSRWLYLRGALATEDVTTVAAMVATIQRCEPTATSKTRVSILPLWRTLGHKHGIALATHIV